MPIEVAVGSGLAKGAKELWKRRAAVSEHLNSLQSGWKLAEQYRWQRFRNSLGSQAAKFLAGTSAPGPGQLSPNGAAHLTLPTGTGTDAPKLQPRGGWSQAARLFDRQLSQSPYRLD